MGGVDRIDYEIIVLEVGKSVFWGVIQIWSSLNKYYGKVLPIMLGGHGLRPRNYVNSTRINGSVHETIQ